MENKTTPRINTSCIWQRRGKPWPNHKHNHWYTDCGAHDYGKLARGLCPHCAKPVVSRTLEIHNGDTP